MKSYTHVFWDWNGTLLNDVEWVMSAMNKLLDSHGIDKIRDVSEHRHHFNFPIIEYYRNLGFDFEKEPFEELAQKFTALYLAEAPDYCHLYDNTLTVLDTIKRKNIKQVVLSALSKDILVSQINDLNITDYFDDILGLTDIYATSKIDVGLDYVTRNRIINAVLIGDSEHDYEVATELGIECLLIARGHVGKDRLLECGVPVLDEIAQVVDYIN